MCSWEQGELRGAGKQSMSLQSVPKKKSVLGSKVCIRLRKASTSVEEGRF